MLRSLLKISKVRNVSRHLDSSIHDTNGLNHGPVWKTQSFLLKGICTVILWQDYCGKGNLKKFLLKYGWKKVSNWECLFVHREKRIIFICVWWMTSNWLERKKILMRCGKYSMKKLIWENQHLSLIMKNLGCTQRQCEMSKDIVDNYRTMFESQNFCEGSN